MIELDLGRTDDLRTHGIVGQRHLICLQTIDIARLTAHPVALVPGSFVAVDGPRPERRQLARQIGRRPPGCSNKRPD